ncbi:MAG: hypothetical protein ACI9ES_001001 [Oceanospirillaceae bacterium]|jgi:hypothetical protein
MVVLKFKFLLSIVLLLLAGCATLNQAQCVSANWYDLGFDNALDGHKSSFVAEHTQACQEYAITPDFEAYKEGWLQAIETFCSPQSGWRYGMAGHYYRNTCSTLDDRPFLDAYRMGRKLYDKKVEIRSLKSEIRSLRNKKNQDKKDHKSVYQSLDRLSLKLELQLLELDLFRLEQNARSAGLW